MSPDRRRWIVIALAAVAVALVGVAAGLKFAAAPRPAPVAGADGQTITVIDDVGRSVALKVPARRAVVFNRYTTEFVRAVAGADAIVGVDFDPDKLMGYWPTVTRAMIAGQGQANPNFEAVIALKPDLVFFPRNSDYQKAADTLKPFGIPVVVMTGWDVLKHEQNVAQLGRIFERPSKADELNRFYRYYRDLLAMRLKGVKRKRVYMEEVKDYSTLLKGSGWHDMIEAGGGENVFGDVDIAKQSSSRGTVQGFDVDPQEILKRRPDVIIKLEPPQYLPVAPAAAKAVLEKIAARPGFAQLPAVKSGQVYNMSYYLAGGCSKIIGALQVAKWLYPDRFKDVDPADAMRRWLEEFQGVPYPGGYWTSLAEVRAS